MTERGKYIVIEGTDGTGKTTQLELLADSLSRQGKDVTTVSEPADPDDEHEPLPIARELRKLVKNGTIERQPETNLHLFTAARIEKWRGEIDPSLKMGGYVLSSRNYWSTVAYQGYGEGLSVSHIEAVTKLALGHEGYLNPDAAIILALEDEDARLRRVAERGPHENPDTFETKGDGFQSRVADGYFAVADTYSIPVVDASGDIATVQKRVIDEIYRQLPDLRA